MKTAAMLTKENTGGAKMALQNLLKKSEVKPSGFQEFHKWGKRKRLNGDLGYGREHVDLELEGDSTLSLGLGCFSSVSDNGRSYGSKKGSPTFLVDKENGLQMDLGLGLANPSSGGNNEPVSNYLTSSAKIMCFGDSSTLTSADSESAICFHASNKLCRDSNMFFELGCLQTQSRDSDCGEVDTEGPDILAVDSGKDAYGMHLQLGLPTNPAAMINSDCVLNMPSRSMHTSNPHETTLDVLGLEHIPVVDEGSTSARWMKSGGCIPSLLIGDRHENVNCSNTSGVGTQSNGLKRVNLSNQEGMAEPSNRPISIRESSGTTTTSGASGGLSDRTSKTCKFPGCGKGARGASGLCIAHGGGRRCQRQGCNKGAEGRTVYCKAHGGGRRCQNLGCTKSAEGKTDFCIAHGGGRRCSHEDCSKAARGRSGLCIRHGGGKRCQNEGCTKSAEGYSGLCISHGGGRRCQFIGCGKGAQGSTMYCKAHGGGKRCVIEGCTKGAEGSTPFCKAHGGGKRCMFGGGGICSKSVHGGTPFCVAHGGGKRCAVQGCTKSARGRTDYCVRHGGGKRCKFEGCGKSAQGSTDFCKAHGGGKRCSWGQEGSGYSAEYFRQKTGELLKGPCDRFARGKLGLCAAHSAVVQDRRVHGDASLGSALSVGIRAGSFQALLPEAAENLQNLESSHSTINISSIARTGNDDDQSLGDEETMAVELTRGGCGGSRRQAVAGKTVFSSVSRSDFSHFRKNPSSSALELDVVPPPVDRINLDLASSLGPSGYWRSPFIYSSTCSNSTVIDTTSMKKDLFTLSGVQLTPGARIPDTKALPSNPWLLIPPMQKGDFDASLAKKHSGWICTRPESEDGFLSTSSLLLPEERVHGGGLMALLAGATGSRDANLYRKIFGFGVDVSLPINEGATK